MFQKERKGSISKKYKKNSLRTLPIWSDWWLMMSLTKTQERNRKERKNKSKEKASQGRRQGGRTQKGKKWATNNNKNLLQKKLKYQKLTKETKNTKTSQNKIN